MSEVTEFLYANPDMEPVFQEFVTQYSSLAEVWENCPRSDWMLWILYKRKYRNAEPLEKYIAWLREQVQQNGNKKRMEMRLKAFDARTGWSKEQIKEDLEAQRITQAEAGYRRFISAWGTATHVSDFVLDQKITDAKLNNLYDAFKNALPDEEVHVPNIDDVGIRIAGLKEQAEKLKEILGNPFELERPEDFYYGRGNW